MKRGGAPERDTVFGMTAPMEVLCEFSTRSESRSSQSSYSEYFMTFDQYLSQLELFLNNQKHDMLGTLIRFDPSTYTPTKNLRKTNSEQSTK